MNYGTYQEEAARALNDLLIRHIPHDQADDDTVLECRHQIITAVRERLDLLGVTSDDSPGSSAPPRVSHVAQHPLQELNHLVGGLPRTVTGTIAPTDLLPGPPARQATTPVDRWRCVARNLMLANHALNTSVSRPWALRDESLWHLTGDVAAVVEGVLVLDHQLGDKGLLPRCAPGTRTSERLIVGNVARLARWFGTDYAADLAHASPLSQLGLGDGPRIHMVRSPEDFASAQRALAAFLRSRKGERDLSARMGLKVARVVTLGQMRLAEAFASWAEREHGGHVLAAQFRQRIPAYQALHRSTLRLVEASPVHTPLPLAQQSELVGQLRRFRDPVFARSALLDLNAATHEVTVSLGRSLRREGISRRNILVLQASERDLGLPRPHAISNTREPFHVACKALADDPVPEAPHERWAAPLHRERLRATLEEHPTTSPPALRRPAASRSRVTQRGR